MVKHKKAVEYYIYAGLAQGLYSDICFWQIAETIESCLLVF